MSLSLPTPAPFIALFRVSGFGHIKDSAPAFRASYPARFRGIRDGEFVRVHELSCDEDGE